MRATTLVPSLLVLLSIGVAAVGCGQADPTYVTKKKPATSSGGTGGDTDPGPDDGNGTGTTPPAGTGTTPPAPGTAEEGTWADGKQLAANVSVAAGKTLEIAPGATVTAAAGVAITVQGTLRVKSTSTHAKITGQNWQGIVVAKGGTLEIDGLDLVNAKEALWVQAGNAGATVLNASLDNVETPFKMEPGSKLAITSSKVKATGASTIAGTFTMAKVDYDKTSAEGLELGDAAGSMTISDSVLHGAGGGDFVVARAGKLVKVEYTTVTGAHCGFHFDDIAQFAIDHVSDDTNSYGAMLYGSGAGPNTISYSNFRSMSKDLDMQNTNGPLTIDHTYTGGKNTLQGTAKTTNAANAPIADAKPRS